MTDPGQAPPPHAPSPGTAEAPYDPPSPFETTREPEPPASSWVERIVYVACCVGAGLVASVPAAWLWLQVADPPSTRLTAQGLKFGETSFDQLTTITMWFFVIGVGFGLVLGLVAASLGRRHGWVAVLAVLVMSWVGSALMVWFGVHAFGPDNPIDFVALFNGTTQQRTEMLQGFHPGDLLVSTVEPSTRLVLLGWPIGGMIGVLASASWWPTHEDAPRQNVQMEPSARPR